MLAKACCQENSSQEVDTYYVRIRPDGEKRESRNKHATIRCGSLSVGAGLSAPVVLLSQKNSFRYGPDVAPFRSERERKKPHQWTLGVRV